MSKPQKIKINQEDIVSKMEKIRKDNGLKKEYISKQVGLSVGHYSGITKLHHTFTDKTYNLYRNYFYQLEQRQQKIKFIEPSIFETLENIGNEFNELKSYLDKIMPTNKDAMIDAYSHGYHDGQQAMYERQPKPTDTGGDSGGLAYYESL